MSDRSIVTSQWFCFWIWCCVYVSGRQGTKRAVSQSALRARIQKHSLVLTRSFKDDDPATSKKKNFEIWKVFIDRAKHETFTYEDVYVLQASQYATLL